MSDQDSGSDWDDVDGVEIEDLKQLVNKFSSVHGLSATHVSEVTLIPGSDSVLDNVAASVTCDVSPSRIGLAKELAAAVDEQLPGCDNLIQVCPTIGDMLPDPGVRRARTGEDVQLSNLIHNRPGAVPDGVVLFFSCLFPTHKQAVLDLEAGCQHQPAEAADRVPFAVAISVDDDISSINTFVRQNNIAHVNVVWGNEERPGNAAESFGLYELPTALVVKDGVITWRGQPTDLNMTETLKALSSPSRQSQPVVLASNQSNQQGAETEARDISSLPDDEYLGLIGMLQHRFVALDPAKFEELECVFQETTTIKPGDTKRVRSLTLSGIVDKEQEALFQDLWSFIRHSVSGDVTNTVQIWQRPSPPRVEPICCDCQSSLADAGFTVSLDGSCPRCVACSVKADRQDVFYAVACGGNLANIMYGRENVSIDVDRGVPGGSHDGVVCDECATASFSGSRFKCACCRDYDLCSECFLPRLHHVQPEDDEHSCQAFLCISRPGQIPEFD